tara:strand:- start:620 stop:1015 length:396 start_codon:yes stop_codon:yes gene_type:complete
MKKILILLTSMFFLVGCIESVVTLGGGLANGKFAQSSLQSTLSYGVKKETGKTPFMHVMNSVKKKKTVEKKNSCSSFVDKTTSKICLMVEKKIVSYQVKIKEKKSSYKSSQNLTSSLQFSINEKSKIKYLD